MKTPTEILAPIGTRRDFRQAIESGQQQKQDALNRRERLADIWAALSDSYGNAFNNQFGDEPNQTWADGLAGHTVEQISVAVGQLIKQGADYAPNLAAVLGAIGCSNKWEHSLQSRPCHEVLAAPVVDLGEGNLIENNPIDPNKTPADYFAEMRTSK
jgi:hypothetical protein